MSPLRRHAAPAGLPSSAYHYDERRAQGALVSSRGGQYREGKQRRRCSHAWGCSAEGAASTFPVATAAAAAGRLEKNAVSFLHEMSGSPSSFLLPFLLPLELGFFLIAVAPGLRPAPGRHPPGLPCKASCYIIVA